MAWCGKALVCNFENLTTIVLIYLLLGIFCTILPLLESYRYPSGVRRRERNENVNWTLRCQPVPPVAHH